MTPRPAHAVVEIDDGATYTVSGYETAADDFDVDHQATEGGGTLAISPSGTLVFSVARWIENTHSQGKLDLAGTLVHNAPAPSTVFAPVDAAAGSVLRASQSALYLSGGGSYEGNLDANGGDLYFSGSGHTLNGASITGSHSIFAYGSLGVLDGVNPATGPATGGLVVQGGTITGLGGLLGGFGNGMISVARASFGNGTVQGARIRITGTGAITNLSTIALNGGGVINEGVFTHNHLGKFDADAELTSGGGLLENLGTWNLTGFSDVSNTGGEGDFINHGTVRQIDPNGFSIIDAGFTNKTGATLRVDAGSLVQLAGGGSYENGSHIVADGSIALRGGTHFVSNVDLTGSGALRADFGGNIILTGNVGPLSGAATGGFTLSSGSISDFGIFGGGGNLAAERGVFQSGTVSGARLRFTGASEKTGGSTTDVDFGSITNEGTFAQRDGGHFQLDNDELESIHGTLVNLGTWTMEGASDMLSANGKGLFRNSGLLEKTGNLQGSFIRAEFENEENATLSVATGALLAFTNGGRYDEGTHFQADGDIAFGAGYHAVHSSTLAGGGYLRTLSSSAEVALFGAIGPISGPATGGFHLAGGTVRNAGGLLGGGGIGILSAERGKLGWGTIDGATLRFTGASEKLNSGEVEIRTGKLIIEGTLTQAEEGDFELDPDETAAVSGTIENHGSWSVVGDSAIDGFYGEGAFQNYGQLQVVENAGTSFINVFFDNKDTGVLRALEGGSISLLNSSSHLQGSVMDAAGGPIYLNMGVHLLYSSTILGADAVRCFGDATHVISRVGAEHGPATGGFSIEGGVLKGAYLMGLGIVLAGPGVGHIAVDHGNLTIGRIENAHLRYTGSAQKSSSLSAFAIANGSLTNDGTFTQSANGNFELHAASPENDGGTIRNRGLWQSLGASTVQSTTGGGLFANAGTLTHAAGDLTISAPFENESGGTITTTGGTVILSRDSTHRSGSVLNADGGNISLRTQTHAFHGGSISGAAFVELPSGTMQVSGNVGPVSGPATGRLSMNGGTLDGTARLSVSDVNFQHGLITGSVTLRATGTSSKSASEILAMNGGIFLNEGVMSMAAGSQLNLDSAAGGGAGVLRNYGDFYTLGGTLTNTGGAGIFENHGLNRNDAGNQTYQSAFENHGAGRLRNLGANIYLSGGGIQYPGSVLEAVNGPIYLNGGTHTFHGGAFEGANMTYCTAGTLMLQGDVGATVGAATGGFGIAGGTVTGTGTISAERGYFSSGTLGGSVVLRFTSGFTKLANTVLNMDGGTLESEGLYDTAGSTDFNLDSSSSPGAGTIVNRGTWRLNNASNYSNSYGGGRFVNYGLFESMLGNSALYCAFDSMAGSTLRANAGILRLLGGGVQYPGSTLHTNGGDIYYSGGAHQLLGGTFTGGGFVFATGGTVSVDGDVGATTGPATGGFGISSGTVTGSAMISSERGSFLSGTVGGGVTIRVTGGSTKWGGSVLNLDGGTVRNEGTLTQQGDGSFDLDSNTGAGGGTIVNTGTWNHSGASNIFNSHGGGAITNRGLWQVLAGNCNTYAPFLHAGDSVFRVSGGQMILLGGGVLKPTATLDAAGGAIYLNGGTHTLEGGTITGANTVYTGAGNTVVTGDVGATSGPATGGFGIYNNGLLSGSEMLSVERGYLAAGGMGGTVMLRLTGESNKVTNTMLNMNGGTIRNDGTMNVAASGDINLDSGDSGGAGTILNKGTWRFNNAFSYSNSFGGGVFRNEGLVESLAGISSLAAAFMSEAGSTFRSKAGYVRLSGGGVHQAGSTFDADGGDIYFSGGTHQLLGGSLTGSTYVYATGGTLSVEGNAGATTGPATGGFGISSGTVVGTGMISAERGSFLTGTMGGTVTLRYTGASTKWGNSVINMDGGTIRNDGTFTQQASGDFNLDSASGGGAGNLANYGTWIHSGGSNISNAHGGGGIDNFGLWQISSGNSNNAAYFTHQADSTFRVSGGQMIFTGGSRLKAGAVIETNNGYLYLNGGTHTLEGGTLTGSHYVYCGAGTTTVTGDVGAVSGPASGGFGIFSNGSLTGSAMLSVDHGYLAAGNIGGSVTLRLTGASDKITNTVLNMSGGTILNEGTMNVAASGDINLDSDVSSGGGTIVNSGTWKHLGSCNLGNTHLEGSVQNSGTFEVMSGTTSMAAHFTNSGSALVTGGTLSLQRGSAHTGALISNSSVSFVGSGHSVSGANAYLGGTGSFSGNATLAEGAALAPGNSTGNLTLHGTIQMLAGSVAPAVRIELESPAAFDRVSLGNGANLALGSGVADLVLDLQFRPSHGQVFRIVSAGTGTGVFGGRFRNAPASGDLITAVYQGNPYHFRVDYDGGGKHIDLVHQSGYRLWTAHHLLSGGAADFDADSDGDGIPNGIEFITGRDPRPGIPDAPRPGEETPVLDGAHLRFVHRRAAAARYLPAVVQYDTDLKGQWTNATDGIHGVTIEILPDFFGAGIDKVETRIPRTLAPDGRMFLRLWAEE
jgi:hypothetical protein